MSQSLLQQQHFAKNAILALDSSAVTVDQVYDLNEFCPTNEEMEMLTNYAGDKEILGECEQVNNFRDTLNIIKDANKEIKESTKLAKIMQIILMLGNKLNAGIAQGSAEGFKLGSLERLGYTWARDKNITLLHFLCKKTVASRVGVGAEGGGGGNGSVDDGDDGGGRGSDSGDGGGGDAGDGVVVVVMVGMGVYVFVSGGWGRGVCWWGVDVGGGWVIAEQTPELLYFYNDMTHLQDAYWIQIKDLYEEKSAIINSFQKVKQEFSSSVSDGSVSAKFRKALRPFLDSADAKLPSLISLFDEVYLDIESLVIYFGEDPDYYSWRQGLL
uniref:FH2 domain-containing protein n=1 Tax=Lactuca sativa TaxID=4236 RepID=A0A9R1VES4_LACSA|nr:hypothetical protein LSAT_V11C500248300 [Lactuca sativa]